MTIDSACIVPPLGVLPKAYTSSPRLYRNPTNLWSPCGLYQRILSESFADYQVFMHNDITIHDEDWELKVLGLFGKSPNIVAVGLGGGTGLGNKDLYRKPFNIWNMARSGYGSNQTDAETHGARVTEPRRVAVLDAFFMAVSTAWLRSVGGWPTEHLTHHCLDLWLACEAARRNKEIWTVGVSCTHHGGGASTTESYAKAPWLQGGTRELDHLLPHKWLFNEYRDVLPIQV